MPTPSPALRLALLQYPVEQPSGMADYVAKLDHWLAEAAAGGAQLAVLPEYSCMELAPALAGTGSSAPDAAGEIRAMLDNADAVLEAARQAAIRHGLWLVAGSIPMRNGGKVVNRAPFIAPDGKLAFQDKLHMTRYDSEIWGISAGDGPQVFETPWGKLGVSICYDVEFPKHVRSQIKAGAWLVLTPTCTDTMHGFNRVQYGARARALENQCFVGVSPTIGQAPGNAGLDVNRGFAGVYGPIDRGFPEDGVIARGALDAAEWVFATLDPARIETVRTSGAVRNHHDWPTAYLPPPQPARFA